MGPNFRAQARASSPSRQVSPPFTCPVQPLKGEPRNGPGRLLKASRVRACEARPRAPHPTGLGYPAPIKLSLCPTSGSPLEAPLTGQDTRRISEVVGTGIGIHSQVRERRFSQTFVPRTQHRRVGKGTSSRRAHHNQAKAVLVERWWARRKCAFAHPTSL